jgi:hypothetical protein
MATRPDWKALLAVETADPVGFAEWLDALWRAIEGRDPGPLAAMFSAGRTPPPELGPVIAQVFMERALPKPGGRPPKVTPLLEQTIRLAYDTLRADGRSHEAACGRLADVFGVSDDTIKRAVTQNL